MSLRSKSLLSTYPSRPRLLLRTYSGLLSLMQISTREKDWIIDTLQPWRHKLEVINEVFADPKIVKVKHGTKLRRFEGNSLTMIIGLAGRIYGYLVASEGLRPIHCWAVRYLRSGNFLGLSRTRSSILAKAVCRLRRRQEIPVSRLADTVRFTGMSFDFVELTSE